MLLATVLHSVKRASWSRSDNQAGGSRLSLHPLYRESSISGGVSLLCHSLANPSGFPFSSSIHLYPVIIWIDSL